VAAWTAAFYVQGLKADRKDHPDQERYFRALYETVREPFVDQDGNAYVLRTVAIQTERSPQKWQDVREDLTRDIRRIRAEEEAADWAQVIAEEASGSQNLSEVFDRHEHHTERLPGSLLTPEPFARKQIYAGDPRYGVFIYPGAIPSVGSSSPELMDKIFVSTEAATQPSGVFPFFEEQQRRWLVVQREELLPVNEADYEKHHQNVYSYLRGEALSEFLAQWFKSESIKKRNGWKDLAPAPGQDDAAQDAQARGDGAKRNERS
jgi:hypothetical protein